MVYAEDLILMATWRNMNIFQFRLIVRLLLAILVVLTRRYPKLERDAVNELSERDLEEIHL